MRSYTLLLLSSIIYLSVSAQTIRTTDDAMKQIEIVEGNDSLTACNIYKWITTNIKYDMKGYQLVQSGVPAASQSPDKVVRFKKGVCEGYANLYESMCTKAGLKCEIITGYARGGAYRLFKRNIPENHAWNAVLVDGDWRLVECTWGAGYLDQNSRFHFEENLNYFFADPQFIGESHYPFDPMWQLRSNPSSHEQYSAENNDIRDQGFSYNDTIRDYLKLDDTEQMITSSHRMLRYDNQNPIGLSNLASFYLDETQQIINRQHDRLMEAQKNKSTLSNQERYMNEIDKAERYTDLGEKYIELLVDRNGQSNLKAYRGEAKAAISEYRTYFKKQRKWFTEYFKNPVPLG